MTMLPLLRSVRPKARRKSDNCRDKVFSQPIKDIEYPELLIVVIHLTAVNQILIPDVGVRQILGVGGTGVRQTYVMLFVPEVVDK